ncbi:hypothetical protein VNI00_017700 [Paramarasmius palmivorus]|uniref:Retrotransposon gag domain-containing protein n=1 Tax=Paramarasmius palmivorus TaxID=297713 RepID=A0AAW0B3N5_9AGAR
MGQILLQMMSQITQRILPQLSQPEEEGEEKEINAKIAAESKIDIYKLELFSADSRDQWRPFISTIYNIIHVKPYTYANSDRRIAMTSSYFTGKALAAYQVLVEHKVKGNYVPELKDWNTFLETFAKMFGHENEALMARVKIGNIKQKEKESFSGFYLCFAEAAVDTGYDAITLHHLLLTHSNEHFRGRLMLASQLPETYEGLVAMLRIQPEQNDSSDKHVALFRIYA